MGIRRRTFIKIGSLATLSTPFILQACRQPDESGIKSGLSGDEIYEFFRMPPSSSRVFVRWWWNGDRLTEKEILRELDIMKKAGIGGVEINPIRFPYGAEPGEYRALDWLSDDWIDQLGIALKGARDRDIICDSIVGSGWPFGGEFLEREEQTQLLTYETLPLEGPETFRFSKKTLLDEVDPPIHSKYEDVLKEIREIRLVPAALDEFQPGQILFDGNIPDNIEITVPEGRFFLYYLVRLTGFQAVINGAPGAAGPVLNHYNRSAVEKYLNRMSEGLSQKLGSMGDHFRAMFCDSLEMEGANWVDDLPDEFLVRRGYDLRPFLPFVLYRIGHMGNPLGDVPESQLSASVSESIQRVRYDFYITRLELFKERFIDTFNEWCNQNGVKSRIQAYGRGYHPLEASLYIDIPECETWLRETVGTEFPDTGWQGRAYSVINKFVASGARLAGKRRVSCEEITNTSMVFNATLETIKVTGDQSNLSGVTHSVLHGFNYSPPDVPFPGWVQYGTFLNERNPWWSFFRKWSDYKARLSSVFLNAEPYADIAILHPMADLWMKFGPQRDPFPLVNYPEYQHNVWEAIQQHGFGCDYVSEGIILDSVYSDGKMIYNNRSYTTLILLEIETILPDTAGKLLDFAEAGGTVIFVEKVPYRSPGYLDHEKNDLLVKNTISEIMQTGNERVGVYTAPKGSLIEWFGKMADRFSLTPYMKIDSPNRFINQVYFKTKDLDIFFIANYDVNASHAVSADFDVAGKVPWLWDPETGGRKKFATYSAGEKMTLNFGPAESKLIVFDRNREGEVLEENERNIGDPLILKGPWIIALHHVDGTNTEIHREELFDFNQDDKFRKFAGEITYHIKADVQRPEEYGSIDLGVVNGVSELRLNGKYLGIRWYGIHRYPLKGRFVNGMNDLEIKVTTVLGNYMKSLEDNLTAQRWTSGQSYQPLGLLGPVLIYKVPVS